MGYTDTQRAAIVSFRKKFKTNTMTEIDEKEGNSKPLTAEQKNRLAEISKEIKFAMMCRA